MAWRPTRWSTPGVGVWLGAVLLAAGGCGSDTGDRPAAQPDLSGIDLTVGVRDGEQGAVLAELYAQALEANGARVERWSGLGQRADYLLDLEGGAITVVVETTQDLLAHFGQPNEPVPRTTDEQVDALRDALPASLTALTPSSAHDSDSVACRRATVERYELVTQSDLEAMTADTANTADDCRSVTAADPVIERDELVVLVDDELRAPNDAIIPLVRTEAVTPAVQATLDAVSTTLDTAALRMLTAEVTFDGEDPVDVVRKWLDTVGLEGPGER